MMSSSVLWFYGNTYSQSRNLTQHDSQVQSRLHLHLAVLKKTHFKYLICEKLNLFGWLHTSTRYSPEEQRVYRCSTQFLLYRLLTFASCVARIRQTTLNGEEISAQCMCNSTSFALNENLQQHLTLDSSNHSWTLSMISYASCGKPNFQSYPRIIYQCIVFIKSTTSILLKYCSFDVKQQSINQFTGYWYIFYEWI